MYSEPELKFRKSSIFVKQEPRKRRPKMVSKSAILEILIIRGVKSTQHFPLLTEMLQFSHPGTR